MEKMLRVGIIGASAGGGWAKVSHVPAVQALAGLKLEAVVTNSQASADEAARAFGVEKGYGDAAALFRDPAIDLVTVAVSVPYHRALVLAAIDAGKHLYCEWPLGSDLAEAEELAAAARKAGIHAAIGLQTRMNPAARHARDLIVSGAIGRVLSARVVSATMAFGPKVEPSYAFAENPAKGTNLVTIQGGHTLDLVNTVLGPFSEGAAMGTTQYPSVTIGDDPAPQTRSTFDHILVQARLAAGPAAAIEVMGGRPSDAVPFRFEATGDKGSLVLEGGAPRGFQSGRLRLLLNGERQHVEEAELSGLPDEAANVAGIYAALRDDVANGISTAPGFDHAVRLTHLVGDLLDSAATGTRKPAREWPEAA
ncbi:MAG: Gfo/Idh/MocA family oxidoreductase [Acetobacteraceae bacterium]|nr:Gfo/Idh/MocA family oxidoreductase [Acetobacteraceae bacterium]